MNPERLLKHFDQISEAPDAVLRLRRVILDLAVRGKLVEQDPKDEPAAEILKRIEREKLRLGKGGKLPKPRRMTQQNAEDLPRAIPKLWKWCHLAEISLKIHYGYTASANPILQDIRLLRITDIQNNNVRWESVPGCEIVDEQVDQYLLADGDILIARTGGTIGKSFLVKAIPVKAVFASYLIRVQGSREVFDRYLKIFLESSVYWRQLEDGSRGAGQPNVNGQTLGNMAVPLPPLPEQHRIVAKVDELMALCDELEAAQQKRERRRDRLVATTLNGLGMGVGRDGSPSRPHSDSNEIGGFGKTALPKFFLTHLPGLTTRPEHIQQLRQTILNLAVRGKLVPQDLHDEPAVELLCEIATEKQRLIAEGTIKKINSLPPISEEERPFDLPPNWSWERFGNIAAIQSNLVKPQDYPKHPHIAPDNIESRTGKLLPYVTVAESKVSSAKHLFFPNSIIYSKIRPNLAKATIVNFEGLCSADAYPIYSLLNIRYLLIFMLSEAFVSQSVKEDNRVAMPKINQEALSKILLAVPSLAEQHRIVAKVEELMGLCDELEFRLTSTATTRHQFLEVVFHEALSGKHSFDGISYEN